MKENPEIYVVRTHYEDGFWTASSDDIPGLVTEAADFEQLRRHVMELTPELMAANCPQETRDAITIVFEGVHAVKLPIKSFEAA